MGGSCKSEGWRRNRAYAFSDPALGQLQELRSSYLRNVLNSALILVPRGKTLVLFS
jgi:hypothetical protein